LPTKGLKTDINIFKKGQKTAGLSQGRNHASKTSDYNPLAGNLKIQNYQTA